MQSILDVEYYDSDDIQGFLGVSRSTLVKWRSEKKGPKNFKLAGRVLYPQAEFLEFMRQQREEMFN